MDISKMEMENGIEILKLAVKEIEALNLKPEQYEQTFFRSTNGIERQFVSIHVCGTAGCFGGWWPHLESKIFEPKPEDFNNRELKYFDYHQRILGFEFHLQFCIFLFGAAWENSTIQDAIKRANYLIEHKETPYYFPIKTPFKMSDYFPD